MAAAQAAENHGDEVGLTWYFLCGIYTSIPTWTHSQNSLAAAVAPSLKISSHLSNDLEDHPNQHKNMRWNGTSCYELVQKSIETETATWSEFPNGGKTIVEQIYKYTSIRKKK